MQADQQSSIMLCDAEVLYQVLHTFGMDFLISLDSETSLSSELSPVHTGKTEVCLSRFTEHLLRCDLAEDKYFSSNSLIWYLSP